MKLNLLKQYKKYKKIPKIDASQVNCIMKILCNEATIGRPPKQEIKKLKDKLTKFNNKHYKPLLVILN